MKKIILIIFAFMILISCSKNRGKKEVLDNMLSDYSEQGNLEKAFEIGEYYNENFRSKKEIVEEGIAFIEKAYDEYKNDKINMLLGNYYTIYGGVFAKKLDYSNAMKYIDIGCSIMDEEVEKHPDESFYLLYRGINSVSLPKMLGRLEYAINDLDKLYRLDTATKSEKILALYNLSDAYKKNGDKDKAKETMTILKEKYPEYKDVIKK